MSDPTASDARLRVLVVSLGRYGGVTKYGWFMARALKDVCEVAAVYSADAENASRWSEVGIPRLAIRTFKGPLGMLVSFFAWARFARIRRFAHEFAPDVIYYPGGHVWKPVLDLVLPRRASVVLTLHDPELHPGEDSLLHRALDRLNRLRVDGWVVLTERARARMVADTGIPAGKIASLPHGIFDEFDGMVEPLSSFAEFSPLTASSGEYLLSIGRIRPYKGIGVLLRAYAALDPATAPPLVIAGSGDFSAEESALLASLSDRRITLINRWLDDREAASLTAAARWVVLPYLSATQSGVVTLSSAYGVPAIASDAGGLVEQVVDGVTGLVVPAGDVDALATALAEAVRMSDEAYERMSRACREHAEREWGWERLASGLVAFMGRLRADAC